MPTKTHTSGFRDFRVIADYCIPAACDAVFSASSRRRLFCGRMPPASCGTNCGMKVTIKNWHAVASWTWTTEDDVCGICRAWLSSLPVLSESSLPVVPALPYVQLVVHPRRYAARRVCARCGGSRRRLACRLGQGALFLSSRTRHLARRCSMPLTGAALLCSRSVRTTST